MKEKTLLYNGQIFTVNKNDDIAEAILFEDDRILFVGKTADALRLIDENTEWKDLYGCAVLPGFVDCHIHMAVAGARIYNQIDLSKKAGVEDINGLLERVKKAAGEIENDDWVIGSNYSNESLKEKRHITAEELDKVAPRTPVLIIHTSGHISVANTKALEIAESKGFKMDRDDVLKNENQKPTGILQEGAHFAMLKLSPVLPSDYELISGIEKFSKELIKRGITTAHDAGGFGAATFRTLQRASEEKKLFCRTYPMLWTLFGKSAQIDVARNFFETGFYTGLGDKMLKMGPLKIMTDGSAVGGTCAVSRPLMHLGEITPTTFTQEEVDEIFIEGHRLGFQLTAHAVGDRAIEMVLDSYEKAMTAYPRKDARHRIEHCFLCPPNLIERIKKLGVLPIPNPGFLSVWGGVFEKYYGDRIEDVMPLKSFEDAGIITPFGSDAMVIEEYEPLFGIAAAMERRDLKTGSSIGEEQKISLMRAIRCYTYFGAYASFEEKIKGSLEKGKLADLVVLSSSIAGKTPEEIRGIKVTESYLGGKRVV